MKLATISGLNGPRVQAVVRNDSSLIDLQSAWLEKTGAEELSLQSMLAVIEGGERSLDIAREALAWADGRIEPLPASSAHMMAPLPEPVQMRDSLCFELHCLQGFTKARELRAALAPDPAAAMQDMEERGILSVPKEFYDFPIYYKQNRFSVCGTETEVVWPTYSKIMDYELELGVIIGKTGMNIAREDALGHIFGYTIFNDLSARDAQFAEAGGGLGPAKGKDFRNGNVIGPWITTADEISDPYDLEMVVRVNGEERGRGNSASMHWRFEDLIARISDCEELRAGEFLGSGTVGNGCGLEVGQFLEHGDVVELEIERIGVLRNRIVRAIAD